MHFYVISNTKISMSQWTIYSGIKTDKSLLESQIILHPFYEKGQPLTPIVQWISTKSTKNIYFMDGIGCKNLEANKKNDILKFTSICIETITAKTHIANCQEIARSYFSIFVHLFRTQMS